MLVGSEHGEVTVEREGERERASQGSWGGREEGASAASP